MSRTEMDTLFVDIEENIATITLNRPDKLNAFNGQMMNDLIAVFDQTDADDNVRAIIVTGEGRAFCAGADLSSGGNTFDRTKRDDVEQDLGENDTRRDGGGRVALRIYDSLKPVIAAVNGPAVGIGATMQLPMDIRIASETARFGFVFSRRGIVMEATSSWFLPRLVGPSTALEWCYSGDVFPAAHALERGLVRSVHAPDELMPAARAIARNIAENTSQISVAVMRQMIWRMLGADHPMEAHKIDSRGIDELGRGADVREGVTSFLEKRKPDFPSRVSKDMPSFYPWWTPREFK